MKNLLRWGAVCLLGLAPLSSASAQTEITLGRFFGACEGAGTNISEAVGEACIIQTIINAFDAEKSNISVNTLPTDWGNYYDQIKASYAGGNPPDIHVMHRHRIPEFAGLGAIAALTPAELKSVGIDVNDWSDSAREAVSYNNQIYGVPLDFHANLWHINMDLFKKAGLIHPDGTPMLPSSPQEMLEHAQKVKAATGKNYLAADFAEFPIGVRLVLALLWQQNSNVFDGKQATINTPEAQKAIKAITALFDQSYANTKLNYADSQQSFLNGDAAVLVNGTWVVDFYTAEAAKPEVALGNYYVADFPTLFSTGATWADSHMWAIPASLKSQDADKFQASLELMGWINAHNIDWARTGHMAVRKSVLQSPEYAQLPHRSEYAHTGQLARDVPPARKYGAIQDVLNRELQAIWLTGKSVDSALADAEAEVQRLLR